MSQEEGLGTCDTGCGEGKPGCTTNGLLSSALDITVGEAPATWRPLLGRGLRGEATRNHRDRRRKAACLVCGEERRVCTLALDWAGAPRKEGVCFPHGALGSRSGPRATTRRCSGSPEMYKSRFRLAEGEAAGKTSLV